MDKRFKRKFQDTVCHPSCKNDINNFLNNNFENNLDINAVATDLQNIILKAAKMSLRFKHTKIKRKKNTLPKSGMIKTFI